VARVTRDTFEIAAYQWHEGDRRIREAPPEQQRTLERVVEGAVAELRRRLGGPFRASELVTLYEEQGTRWVMEIAAAVAPEDPWAWDQRVADAAFARYLREASDYAGGRRVLDE
jgi:sugar phosphate isomerase/epimerase